MLSNVYSQKDIQVNSRVYQLKSNHTSDRDIFVEEIFISERQICLGVIYLFIYFISKTFPRMLLQNAESSFGSNKVKQLLNGTATTTFPLEPTKIIALKHCGCSLWGDI